MWKKATKEIGGTRKTTGALFKKAGVFWAVVVLASSAAGQPGPVGTLVVPNGFERLEGNSWFNAEMNDEGAPGFRQQLVISRLQFASARRPIWITQVASRPDVQVTGSREFTYFDVEWRLSTTDRTPQTMSIHFSDNVGPDETVVYTGDWTLATDGGSGLKHFDYVLELEEPFYYDPSQGDLLLDFICRGGFSGTPTDSSVMDGQWVSEMTHFCSAYSPDPGQSSGELIWQKWTPIHRFTYHPASPSSSPGDVNGDGQVDCADIQVVMDGWRTNDPFCDIAPEPDGDGLVDEQDLILLIESIDANSLPTDSDPNLDLAADASGCRATDVDRGLVIPNGFDTLEGNSWTRTELKDDWPHGFREQDIYSHLQFEAVGGPMWILGERWRPDRQVTGPRELTYQDLEIRLSTTDSTPKTMNTVFRQNVGPDETEVFSGDLTISTPGRDSLEDFDYEVEYQVPFYYDPRKGDLLVEYVCHGQTVGVAPIFDGQWVSDRTHFAYLWSENPEAAGGTVSADWIYVSQFIYVPISCPDLKGDLNGDEQVDGADVYILARHWGTDDVPCDIAPEPLGDGTVDEQDLRFLLTCLDTDCPRVYWRLDETEGSIAHDSVGGINAYAQGLPTWQPDAGRIGGAIACDGVNDHLIADFRLDPSKELFSVFAWIQGGAPGQVVLSQMNGSHWLGITPLDGCLMSEVRTGSGNMVPLLSQASITDGQWHCIGLVWDGMQRTLYVDGVEVAADVHRGLTATGGSLVIGAAWDLGPKDFFSGLIDDVKIYNRAVKP